MLRQHRDFVRLHRTDHVPRTSRNVVGLGDKILRSILTECRQPHPNCAANSFDINCFRHGEKRDFGTRAPRPPCCVDDANFDGLQPGRDAVAATRLRLTDHEQALRRRANKQHMYGSSQRTETRHSAVPALERTDRGCETGSFHRMDVHVCARVLNINAEIREHRNRRRIRGRAGRRSSLRRHHRGLHAIRDQVCRGLCPSRLRNDRIRPRSR